MSHNSSKRLLSLDFMRGLIMALLMFESTEIFFYIKELSAGNTFFTAFSEQLFHNNWQGLHFWDLIQPAFMFIAGISMSFSLRNLRKSKTTSYKSAGFLKILKRSLFLLVLGIVKRIHHPAWFALESLDLTDVLTQLAFTTLIAFFVSDWKINHQVIACVFLLICTEGMYRIPYVPNFIEGYTDGKNTGSYIDLKLLGQFGNHYVFINWLPTAVHTIAGLIVGRLILEKRKWLPLLLSSATTLLLIGYLLDFFEVTPIIKPIATTSFIITSLGYCLFLLIFLYWWIDIKKHHKGVLFFQIVGMNSIFIYLFTDMVGRGWLNQFAQILFSPIEFNLEVPHYWTLFIVAVFIFLFEWYLEGVSKGHPLLCIFKLPV